MSSPAGESGLAAASMAVLDQWWDPGIDLLVDPAWSPTERRARVRETCWYALGLLARGGSEDTVRAVRAIDAVLDHQLDQPGTPWHGTWLRWPDEPTPVEGARAFRDYDPNWREFIGCTLVQLLVEREHHLPAELVARMEHALDLAVAGTLARGVDPRYSNIALMAGFLMHAVGRRRRDRECDAHGLELMGQVLEAFQARGAFEEYNSPTYYGIDLYALALWRRYGGDTSTVQRAGAVELALWRDVADHYHAGLRNLAGPYDRSYGMDLDAYASGTGLWLWQALGRGDAPFPDISGPFEHFWDLALAPSVAVLGVPDLPSQVRAALRSFPGPRTLVQPIDGRRVASTVLDVNVMVGAEHLGGDRGGLGDQFHPLTAHWRLGTGVGWLRLVSELTIDVAASSAGRDTAEVRLRWPAGGSFAFQVRVDGLDGGSVTAQRWWLPGLAVAVTGTAALERVESAPDGTWWLHYRTPSDADGGAGLMLQWSRQGEAR
ncbi:hypothetical protein [Occultella gossypii]|uniref:Heparinase II/III-like protein n=1 Tax=Occultella gossypii TaxID=2800820 RepID=A0ABS7SD68_9MICO|nr:hypothetical protein [Occultella gossypii]MBZ2198300.1 hypothetical protein [Occultella gossypii]